FDVFGASPVRDGAAFAFIEEEHLQRGRGASMLTEQRAGEPEVVHAGAGVFINAKPDAVVSHAPELALGVENRMEVVRGDAVKIGPDEGVSDGHAAETGPIEREPAASRRGGRDDEAGDSAGIKNAAE